MVDKNFKNPRTMSATAACERTLGAASGLTGSVSSTHARSDRLTRFVARNDAGVGNPWSTGLPGGNGIGTLMTVESSAESRYSGLTLGLARRNATDWVFDANYTRSWDKSDNDNERDPFTFRYARADQLDKAWGHSDRDQRHRFNAFVLTKLGAGVVMNDRVTYISASPMSEKCGTSNRGTGERAASDPAFGSLRFNFDGTMRSGLGDPRQIQLGMRYAFSGVSGSQVGGGGVKPPRPIDGVTRCLHSELNLAPRGATSRRPCGMRDGQGSSGPCPSCA